MDTLKYWVWLTMAMGPSNHRVWDVTNQYSTIVEAYDGITSGSYNGMTAKEIKSFKSTYLEQAEEIIDYCYKHKINIISFDDKENYPSCLREIYNPPTMLFCYGDLKCLNDSVTVAVVGARKPSEYSIKVAEEVCTNLAKVGTVIVSGFAYGIDSIAHKCALQQRSKTIAVLASGIDYNYPEENAKFKKIIAKCGCVITEYFPGTKPYTQHFKQRNRLISGLSSGIVVIQASNKSGALNTVSHAVSQGKDIFCVPPHDVFDSRYAGVINLLRDGAIPVFSHLDIMYEYYENFSHKLNYVNPYDEFSKKSEAPIFISEKEKMFEEINEESKSKVILEKNNKQDEKAVGNFNAEVSIENKIDLSNLDETQCKIIDALKNGEMIADELCNKLDKDISEILVSLTELELFGYIKSMPGKRYSL